MVLSRKLIGIYNKKGCLICNNRFIIKHKRIVLKKEYSSTMWHLVAITHTHIHTYLYIYIHNYVKNDIHSTYRIKVLWNLSDVIEWSRCIGYSVETAFGIRHPCKHFIGTTYH